ncbi:MAG: hypothetical protein Q7U47_12930, partial [Paludibacter sp.]|nr:hypothetical protein [Paludibacter sp.]
IYATSCKNVTMNNNSVQELTANTAKKIDYGLLVNKITIDNVAQLNAVADPVTGWFIKGTQGDLGWSYGYANATVVGTTNYTKESFVALPYQSSSYTWTPSASVLLPSALRINTQPALSQVSVFRWTSNVSGSLKVVGKINNTTNSSLGNKVVVVFFVNGVEKYRYDMASGNLDLNADLGTVALGSQVDMVVDSKGNTSGDRITFVFKYLSDGNPTTLLQPVNSEISFKAYSSNGNLIIIPNQTNQLLSVYRIDGTLQLYKKLTTTTEYFPLAKGIYIVKLDGNCKKIIVG